uniref:Uncharacterized protein n=1 Tax=Trypanosoma congolense (strain IL3000) TaxID=1068625 RepID=G0UR12_TRYCI|nr:hypothetical protein, unlikely [Trypanosoma congolense IL3000]
MALCILPTAMKKNIHTPSCVPCAYPWHRQCDLFPSFLFFLSFLPFCPFLICLATFDDGMARYSALLFVSFSSLWLSEKHSSRVLMSSFFFLWSLRVSPKMAIYVPM